MMCSGVAVLVVGTNKLTGNRIITFPIQHDYVFVHSFGLPLYSRRLQIGRITSILPLVL